jgi:hypothetical protein
MLKKQRQSVTARRLGSISLAALLLFGGIGTPLVASNRFSELEENSPVKSQFEELSLSHRLCPQRQLRLEARRVSIALPMHTTQPLGHTQNPVLSAVDGHRLPNGLLAPLTC